MSVILETERLILRPCVLTDFDGFAAMFGDPDVARFVTPDGKPMPRFGAWQSLCSTVGHWTLRGFGMFAVVERETGMFVGRVGPWSPEGWPGFEVGWTLKKDMWGKGYATEAGLKCLEYSFSVLDQPQVMSLILPGNLRSIRVAERLGQHLEGDVALPHLPDRPVLKYVLSRDEWRRRSQMP